MGKFIYGIPSVEIELDDKILAHVKAVITAKLRRNESFTFTWEDPDGDELTHHSVWLDSSIPIQFEISGKQDPPLNREWLDLLNRTASTPSGLRIVPEPAQEPEKK
ncbi:MAG: hypothetical protein ABIP33_08685 [Pseudolysinimonas sp.]